MSERALGRHFDDPDSVFNWLNDSSVALSVINVINRSGVTERLLEAPSKIDQLSSVAGVPADKLERLLNFLVAHEIVAKDADGTFQATDRTRTMWDAAHFFYSSDLGKLAGTRMLPALREGKTPFELFFGQPVFEYFHSHPDDAASFGRFMGWMTRRVQRFIFAEHRFEPFGTVADIGGSMGDLLLAVLEEYPGTKGILFDLPEVVEIARPAISASPMADRVEIVGGSFFEAVPAADLYTLKQILHDWHDDECKQILGSIRAAINPGGRLVVIDHIVADVPTPDEAISTDIAMMMWDTGRERQLGDFEALFEATGFRLERLSPNPNGHSVIEAVPV